MDLTNLDLVNSLRSIVTVFAFVSFLAIVLWAFERAARMPLDEEEDKLMLAGSKAPARVERSGK